MFYAEWFFIPWIFYLSFSLEHRMVSNVIMDEKKKTKNSLTRTPLTSGGTHLVSVARVGCNKFRFDTFALTAWAYNNKSCHSHRDPPDIWPLYGLAHTYGIIQGRTVWVRNSSNNNNMLISWP